MGALQTRSLSMATIWWGLVMLILSLSALFPADVYGLVLDTHLAVEDQRAVQPCSLDVAKELAKISLLRVGEVLVTTHVARCAILGML